MSKAHLLASDERRTMEELIKSFDNHGCGFGLDIKAQAALRRLLDALDEANRKIEEYQKLPAS